MERAAKAAEKKTAVAPEKGTEAVAAKKSGTAKASQAKKSEAVSASVIGALSEETEKIIYEQSAGMLDRAAEPNERFGIGDDMPVYYF